MTPDNTPTRGRGRPRDPFGVRYMVRAASSAWSRWRKMAEADGVSLATWLRQAGIERAAREDAGKSRPAGTSDAIKAASRGKDDRQYTRLSEDMIDQWTARAFASGLADLSTWLRQAGAEKECRDRRGKA
jgi:hypothetical protein